MTHRTPPHRTRFRLVDGSQPEDWNPSHGDRPCQMNGHDGTHPLDGCPDMFAAMEPEHDDTYPSL